MTESIERVEAALLRVPLDAAMQAYGSDFVDVLLVTVTDGDGASGTGFTYTLNLGMPAVEVMVAEVLAPQIVGTSPDAWEATNAAIRLQTRRIGPDVVVPALSAVDIAIWDLRARRAGLPLYRLLGRGRTEVAFYGSGRSSNRLTQDDLVRGTLSYVEEGLSAVKLRIGARSPVEDIERVRAVRAAVGDDIVLMVDANEQLSEQQATELLPGLADARIGWIEEPFPAEDVLAHARLARSTPITVAAGEHLAAPARFAEYARERAAGLWQPDPALAGGVTAMLQIAELAAAQAIPVAFHSLPELNVHLSMDDPNVTYVEHFPILDPVLTTPITATDGTVTAPDAPGHGIAWDRDAISRYRR